MKLRNIAVPIFLVVMLGLPSGLAYAADDANTIRRIDVRERETDTLIVIEGSATPTFTVFKLDDPVRLFIDVANADVAQVDRTMEIDNGVLGQVGVLQFRNGDTPVGRIIVGFRQAAAYDVRARGNTIEVVIDGADRRSMTADLSAARAELEQVTRSLAEQKQALAELADARQREERLSAEAREARLAEERLTSSLEKAREEAEAAKTQAQKAHARLLEKTELIAKAAEQATARKEALEQAARREREKLAALEAERERMEEAQKAARRETELTLALEKARAAVSKVERERAEAQRAVREVEAEQKMILRAAQDRETAVLAQLGEARVNRTEVAQQVATMTDEIAELRARAAAADGSAATELRDAADAREAEMLALKLGAEREVERLERAAAEATRRRVEEDRQLAETSGAQGRKLRELNRAYAEAQEKVQTLTVQQQASARMAAEFAEARDEAKLVAGEKETQERAARERARQHAEQEAWLKALAKKDPAARRAADVPEGEVAEVAALEAKVRELEAQRAAQQDATRAATEALAQQRSEVERLQAEAATVRSDLERLRAERAREEQEIAQLTRQLAELRSQKASALSGEARGLYEELGAKEAELRKLRASYDEAMRAARRSAGSGAGGALAAKERELSELATRLAQREEEAAALQAQLRAAGAEDADIAALRTQLSEREGALRTTADRMAVLSEKVDAQSAELQKVRDERAAQDEKIDRLTRFLREQEATIARLKTRGDSPAATAEVEPASAARATISDVAFREDADTSSVVVKLDGAAHHEVQQLSADRLALVLRGAALPGALERSLDTSEFGGPVRMVSTFRDPASPDTVRVEVQLDSGADHGIHQEGDALVWSFDARDQTPAEAVAHVGEAPDVFGRAATPEPVGYGYHPGRVGAGPPQSVGGAAGGTSGATVATGAREGGMTFLKPTRRRQARKYRGKRINLTIKDADIQDVLTFLAREGQVNIVASEGVSGRVSFHLENIPWDLALDMILRAKGLDYVKEHGVYRVAPIDDIQKEFDLELEKRRKITEMKQLIVKLITVNYADATSLADRVKDILSPKGSVGVDDRTNTLIVKDIEDHVLAVEDLVRRLDTQTPQVLIEARIVEASQNYSQSIGIQWGGNFAMSPAFGNQTGLAFPSVVGIAGGADDSQAPTGGLYAGDRPNYAVNLPAAVGTGSGGAIGLTLGSIGGAGNINLRLSAAEEEGTVKIISSPKISTLDNREATIQQGISIPISVVSAQGVNTQFFNAELQLKVKPHVTPDGNIALKLDITKNEPDFSQTGASGNPTIQKKEAHTEILLRDGDTTVIGGIYTRNTSESFKEVPLFAKIPILGWLFKSRDQVDKRTELLIFITPRIVNREAATVSG